MEVDEGSSPDQVYSVVGSLWNQARSYQIFLASSNVLVCFECSLWLSA